MGILEQKKEIVDWILTLENPSVINNIYNIKEKSSLSFRERFAKGLSVEEFRAEMKRRISKYPERK